MKSLLTILSFVPLLLVGGIMVALIYHDEYYFVTMKVLASIGIYSVVYCMYKFTLYLHKKIDGGKHD